MYYCHISGFPYQFFYTYYYNIILVLKMFALTKFTNRACVESVKRSKTVICTSKYYGEFHIDLLALGMVLGLDSIPRLIIF